MSEVNTNKNSNNTSNKMANDVTPYLEVQQPSTCELLLVNVPPRPEVTETPGLYVINPMISLAPGLDVPSTPVLINQVRMLPL